MIRLTRAHVQPIGLDIGHDSVKMLQLEVVGESLAVVAAASQTFSQEAKTQPELRMAMAVSMIRHMLRHNSFSGRRVVAALPRELVHVKNLRLPNMPLGELESAVQFEARGIFGFDVDHARLHFVPTGEVRQGTETLQEVIVLAARNDDVDNYLEQLHRCGAEVDALDVEPCALFRGVERFIRRREDEQEVHVLVDIGLKRTQVVIGKGKDISFYKPIDLGGAHLHEAVSRKLSISLEEATALRQRTADATAPDANAKRDPVRQAVADATRSAVEELGREISLCLRYYSVTFRGQRPARVRLFGGEARDPQLLATLNATLSVPVETGRPLFSVNTSRMPAAARRGSLSEWALALGLALRRTTGKFGARDGKPRDTAAPPPGATAPPGSAHAIDLNKLVAAAGETHAAGPLPKREPALAGHGGAHA